jgi:hypothetical protein
MILDIFMKLVILEDDLMGKGSESSHPKILLRSFQIRNSEDRKKYTIMDVRRIQYEAGRL